MGRTERIRRGGGENSGKKARIGGGGTRMTLGFPVIKENIFHISSKFHYLQTLYSLVEPRGYFFY